MSWIKALRLRTLPLAVACISMGAFLAAEAGKFDAVIFLLCCLTTLLLQILSNLSNDYGDTIHGADHAGRKGPMRMVQSGAISPQKMQAAIVFVGVLCLFSGLALLWLALGNDWQLWCIFLGIGLLCIAAALAYTLGKRPYGYAGLGDLSVFIFFGLVAVMGTYFLLAKSWDWIIVFPSLSCGLFSAGVLNINNLRDLESDKAAGKNTIPVRYGKTVGTLYHAVLLTLGFLSAIAFTLLHFHSLFQCLFLLTLPLFAVNVISVRGHSIDPLLKQLAFSTLLFVLLFGIGLMVNG